MKPIIVSRSSWHYRYIHDSTICTTRSTRDLCSYLGGFVRTFLKQVWFYGVFLISVFAILLVSVTLALGELILTLEGDNGIFMGVAASWGISLCALGVFVGIGWAIMAIRDEAKHLRYRAWLKKTGREHDEDSYYEYRRQLLYRTEKPPTLRDLLRERFKAAKDKVCPVLEVKP